MKRTAKSFPVYLDYINPLEHLSDEEAGQLFKALIRYATDEEPPSFTGPLAAVFAIMQNQLDRDSEKYKEICTKNRANGKMGGRPRSGRDEDDDYDD